jgi:hypothetical protein
MENDRVWQKLLESKRSLERAEEPGREQWKSIGESRMRYHLPHRSLMKSVGSLFKPVHTAELSANNEIYPLSTIVCEESGAQGMPLSSAALLPASDWRPRASPRKMLGERNHLRAFSCCSQEALSFDRYSWRARVPLCLE